MDTQAVVLISVFTLLTLVVSLIVLFIVFMKRKNQLLVERDNIEKTFKIELANSQIEIREETLRNISWELHDNLGQLMSLAKINAQIAKNKPEKIDEVITILGKGLHELRALSKMINPDAIKKLNLVEAVKLEIERYNRLEFIKATLDVQGVIRNIDPNIQIILFRILQEFFSNTIKHSKASKISVNINYEETELKIHVQDDGIGFDIEASERAAGIGLQNMRNRAALIKAQLSLDSNKNVGTSLHLIYNENLANLSKQLSHEI